MAEARVPDGCVVTASATVEIDFVVLNARQILLMPSGLGTAGVGRNMAAAVSRSNQVGERIVVRARGQTTDAKIEP